MKREIGCCSWIFGDAGLEEIADRVKRAGLDGVELFGAIDSVDPAEASAVFKDRGLQIISITPGDADISHPDMEVRQAALDYYDRLMDWAGELGKPLVSCHGQVTRIKPITTQAEEDDLLRDAVARICVSAEKRGLNVVFEILNRYETHQVRTIAEGLGLMERVGAVNLRLLPDAYHMNIEESDPASALRSVGDRIGLYHAADSNRCGIGQGHIDFAAQIEALDEIGYAGPVILECNAPGPNPFTPDKGVGFREIVEAQLAASVTVLRGLGS